MSHSKYQTQALIDLQDAYNARDKADTAIAFAAEHCQALGITATEAAAALGVHRTTISRLYKRATGEEK